MLDSTELDIVEVGFWTDQGEYIAASDDFREVHTEELA
jgi:hypothetical protein